MKLSAPIAALVATASLHAADAPKIFSGLLEQNVPVKAQIGVVLPPQEIDKFIAKVESASRKDPKWFREFSASAKPGAPLPFDERLGLTREEYDEYLKLWNHREFKAVEDVTLLLRPGVGDTWTISATGTASSLTTLRYQPQDDSFRSPNGVLKRIEDIHADSASILGEWNGFEWRFEEETSLGKTKENVAIGRFADQKFGLIVYRAQELSSEGTRLLDKSMVVRFPLSKAGPAPESKPAPQTPEKATKPTSKKK